MAKKNFEQELQNLRKMAAQAQDLGGRRQQEPSLEQIIRGTMQILAEQLERMVLAHIQGRGETPTKNTIEGLAQAVIDTEDVVTNVLHPYVLDKYEKAGMITRAQEEEPPSNVIQMPN